MKKIIIPEDIILNNEFGIPLTDSEGKIISVSFKDFVTKTLLVDPKFGKGMADILSAVEIKSRLLMATEEVDLDNADYDRLLAVVSEPGSSFNPAVVMQLVSFLLAIKNAK